MIWILAVLCFVLAMMFWWLRGSYQEMVVDEGAQREAYEDQYGGPPPEASSALYYYSLCVERLAQHKQMEATYRWAAWGALILTGVAVGLALRG